MTHDEVVRKETQIGLLHTVAAILRLELGRVDVAADLVRVADGISVELGQPPKPIIPSVNWRSNGRRLE